MNLLGFTYGFGARDVGFKSAMGDANKDLNNLNKLLGQQADKGEKSGKMWGKMGERVKQFNVASIASNVRALTGDTNNLTNSIESMGVQYATAAKPIVAQMNLTAKEARKMTGRITGMAIGLNVGAEQVAETMKAIKEAGGPAKSAIDAMGMSEKEWVKVTTTTGVSMQDYSAILGDMVASWGAAPKQAAAMLDNIMAIGKAAGIGSLGIKSAKQQIDALDATFRKLPPTMSRSADEVQDLMESTYKLAGAFREMGESEEAATEEARQTANMFAEQAVAISRAQIGIGSFEESPLFQWLTAMGVQFDEAINIIQTGSRDAVKGSMMLQDALRKGIAKGSTNAEAAISMLNQTMGESAGGLAWLVNNMDTGSAALQRMNALVVNGSGALAEYGRQAHSSGRTLSESLELAQQMFETQFRSIGRADVRNFVGQQIKAYRSMGKHLKKLGKDETWGPILKKISIMNQMGARGVFLSFAEDLGLSNEKALELGAGLELAMKTASQLAQEFSPIMEILGMLGPFGSVAIAGGIASFFLLDAADREEIFGSFAPVIETIGNKIKGIWEKIPWDVIEQKFGEIVDKVKTYTFKVIENLMIKLGEGMADLAPDLARTLGIDVGVEALKKRRGRRETAEKMVEESKGAVMAGTVFEQPEFAGTVFGGPRLTMEDAVKMIEEQENLVQQQRESAKKMLKDEEIRQDCAKKYTALRAKGVGAGLAGTAAASATTRKYMVREGQLAAVGKSETAHKLFEDAMDVVPGVLRPLLQETFVSEEVFQSGFSLQLAGDVARQDIMNRVSTTFAAISDSVSAGWEAMYGSSEEGGKATVENFGTGVEEGTPVAIGKTQDAMQQVANNMGGSLPIDGPLAYGEAPYMGAYSIMESFADGIYDSTEMVRQAVEQTLDDSIILTLEEYKSKVEEVTKQKGLLSDVAAGIVREMGGKFTGTVEYEGEVTGMKQEIEASLNLPAFAGVIAAVHREGHLTRKILTGIYDNTKPLKDLKTEGGRLNVVL